MSDLSDAVATAPEDGGEAANRHALAVIRAILGAGKNMTLDVEGKVVHVEVERGAPPAFPPHGLRGLDPSVNGPLPASVRVHARWDGGSTILSLGIGWWGSKGKYRQLLGIHTRIEETGQDVGWSTIANPFKHAKLEDEVSIALSFSRFKKDSAYQSDLPLRACVERAGLPLESPRRVRGFSVRVATDEVLPSPAEAFRRMVLLAILKLPFFVRDGAGVHGVPPFLPPPEAGVPGADETVEQEDERALGLWPLPGGVRAYKRTLEDLLGLLSPGPMSLDQFNEQLRDKYEVTGETAREGYLNVLTTLGLIQVQAGMIEATPVSAAYLEAKDPLKLFDMLHAAYAGLLEVLVITEELGTADTKRTGALLMGLLNSRWKTSNQVNFRRNWLLSLGAVERQKEGDVLTRLGEDILGAHAQEAETLRERLALLVDDGSDLEADGEPSGTGTDEDLAPGLAPAAPTVSSVPVGWGADRLDLTSSQLLPHLEGLSLRPGVLEQVCAALSSGKHLLLIGPPGTGKTELAVALSRAAEREGYCAGAFVSTASADWTTFDTIGGYALRKDSSLSFRSGAFLRAVERWQWLVIDELNRADVDKAFGELMTVLAGRATDTAFELEDGRTVSIGPEVHRTHCVPKTFRVIATMNSWDKTSLFRLSYAVQRRFAIVPVGVPDDQAYGELLERHASDKVGVDTPLDGSLVARMSTLFSSRGLLAMREVGPAIPLDMIRYMRRRGGEGPGLAEAIILFLLPQLEGLDQNAAIAAFRALDNALATATIGRRELRARFVEMFPHIALPEA